MTKQTKGKTALYAFLGLGLVAACLGAGITLSRAIAKDNNTCIIERPSDSSNEDNNHGSSNNDPSQDSGDNNSSSEQPGGPTTTEKVTINCSAGEVYWNSTVAQGEMNETSFVATLNGLPANATSQDKGLYIYTDDEEVEDWMQIYRVVNGQEVTMHSPYHFQSGDTIHLRQKKLATGYYFYKIPLFIFADKYEPLECSAIIDVWIRTV